MKAECRQNYGINCNVLWFIIDILVPSHDNPFPTMSFLVIWKPISNDRLHEKNEVVLLTLL